MKLTRNKLKHIINEECNRMLQEVLPFVAGGLAAAGGAALAVDALESAKPALSPAERAINQARVDRARSAKGMVQWGKRAMAYARTKAPRTG